MTVIQNNVDPTAIFQTYSKHEMGERFESIELDVSGLIQEVTKMS